MNAVTIVEMGPRDGLQNEAQPVPLAAKIALVQQLVKAGLQRIEIGAFVSPKWVPQMADSLELCQALQPYPDRCRFSVLVPNEKGMEQAILAKIPEVAIFTAASESFAQKNINTSIQGSIERFQPVMQLAQQHQIRVRGYVSCALGCPYEGAIAPSAVARVAAQLRALGCYEISLGDTIGTGTLISTRAMLQAVCQEVPAAMLAAHFHDTYGQALANLTVALDMGIRVIDSAVAGLGGCPYAVGASGNVATEDVLWLLQGAGYEAGVDLDAVIAAGRRISSILGRQANSRLARAR